MILPLIVLTTAAATPIPSIPSIPPQPVKRCGWLINPTPANWWLKDRDGEWTIGEQGGYQAPGLDDLPDMSTRGWVKTNGSYGYGCACLSVTSNARTREIIRIFSGAPVPIKQCRADQRLGRP